MSVRDAVPRDRPGRLVGYLVACVVVSTACAYLYWSFIADDREALLRTGRALPFIALAAVALFIPLHRQLRERARIADALLRANRAMSSIARLSTTGTASRPTEDVLDELLSLGAEAVYAKVGAIFVADAPEKPLQLLANRGDGFPALVARGAAGGLIGGVIANGKPMKVLDASADRLRLGALGDTCRTWIALPLVHGREPIGVVLFGFDDPDAGDADDDRIIEVVASRASAVMRTAAIATSGHRSRLGADHARRQLAMLAEGSKALVAGLGDHEAELRALVDVMVPDFADWCAVDLIEDGDIRRVVAKHVDEHVDAYGTDEPDWMQPCRRVMLTGRSALEWHRTTAERSVPMIAPGITSYVVVPIRLHGLSVGAIACGTAPPRRGFRPSDRATVEELASRIATALERVSLYRATEHSAAEAATRASQLRRIMEAAVAVHAERGLQPTAEVVANQARRVLSAGRAMVLVPGENRDAIRVVVSGDDAGGWDDADDAALGALASAAAEGSHLGRVIDPATHSVHVLVARLTDGVGRALGVLAVADKQGASFTEDDEWSLVSLAQFASIALDNAHLYDSLRAGEERLRALIEASPVAIIELDRHATPRLWNHAAVAMLGSGAAKKRDSTLALHPDTSKLFGQVVADALRDGHTPNIEDRAWRLDGSAVPVGIAAAGLRTAVGELDGVLLMVSDITERRLLEKQVSRAERLEAIGQMAGGVAHDFNNLLTVILGHSELLALGLGDGHPNLDDVSAVRTAAERAASVTSQLLTISRGDLVASEVFDPRQRLLKIQETIYRFLPSSVHLVVLTDSGRGHVRLAPAQFDQLVLNLAVNGRDAMAGGGTLTIRITEGDGVIELSMVDTGEGMDDATAARCFEPFFTTKGAARGTGLGLATVYSVVTGAGGSINVDTSRGYGTTMMVELPSVSGELEPVLTPEHVLRAGMGRILLAEDEIGLRQLATEVLRSAGYIVSSVPDGQAALDLLDASGDVPDLLVTDVMMPRVNGVELAKRLHERHPGLPVLFVSGYAETATRDDLSGADVLIKPFLLHDLIAKVHEVLQRSLDATAPLP